MLGILTSTTKGIHSQLRVLAIFTTRKACGTDFRDRQWAQIPFECYSMSYYLRNMHTASIFLFKQLRIALKLIRHRAQSASNFLVDVTNGSTLPAWLRTFTSYKTGTLMTEIMHSFDGQLRLVI